MRRNSLVAGLLGVALVALVAVADQPDRPATAPKKVGPMAEAIHADLSRRAAGGFSGAIIVEIDGEVVLDTGYGWADRERRTPFTTSTIAQIGSLTKQFTAAAILDLSRQKRLRLSDAISKYLPDVPSPAAGITLEQLLTHTAGLQSDCGDDFEHLSREDFVHRCLALIDHPPGTRFQYSNLGYSALAAIVESVTRQPLEDVVRNRFLDPLHMLRTGTFFSARFHDQQAIGYVGPAAQPLMSDRLSAMEGSYWNLKGNGGMEASAEDMYAWFRALTRPSPISESVKRQLMTPHARRDDTVEYGYGWFIRRNAVNEIEQASHTGSDGVFFSAIVWRPKERAFYYLVTNTGEKGGAEAASVTLKTLKGRLPIAGAAIR